MVWGFNKWFLACFAAVFALGIAVGVFSAGIGSYSLEMPLSFGIFSSRSAELGSPSDRIQESNIHVLSDKIVIDIKDASWASFTDTNSMDPFIDSGANSIEIKPESEEDVHVGDVISFRTIFADGLIIHRVIEVGEDSGGRYFITKGDNSPAIDPGKRRFDDISGVVVGVIY